MTKERKTAIKQWEKIRDRLYKDGIFEEPYTGYEWLNNRWFCQYVRNHHAVFPNNGCSKCPLLKWVLAHQACVDEEDCGCACWPYYDTLYYKVCDENRTLRERIKACDLIIEALKGKHIWEKC